MSMTVRTLNMTIDSSLTQKKYMLGLQSFLFERARATRHSLTTRLLYSCISAKLYSGDHTLDALLVDLATQLKALGEEGVEARLLVESMIVGPKILCMHATLS